MLEKLGLMAVNKGDGDRRMPSLSKAKQVGEKRALEKEMQVRAQSSILLLFRR